MNAVRLVGFALALLAALQLAESACPGDCSLMGICTGPNLGDIDQGCECFSGRAFPDCAAPTPRVTDGSVLLYTFFETEGCVVHDVSGHGYPFDLELFLRRDRLTWLPGGGIVVDQLVGPTAVASLGPEYQTTFAVQASGEFSVEFWIVPAALVTTGPAVIASIASSNDPTEIQLAVIQSDDSLIFRFNAGFCGTTTDPACELTVGAALSSVVAPTHVVFTFDGTDRYVYINDVASGPFSSPNSGQTVWPSLESAYRLVLFNSPHYDLAWSGTMHLFATYSVALSAASVTANYQAGATTATLFPMGVPGGYGGDEMACTTAAPLETAVYHDECWKGRGPAPECVAELTVDQAVGSSYGIFLQTMAAGGGVISRGWVDVGASVAGPTAVFTPAVEVWLPPEDATGGYVISFPINETGTYSVDLTVAGVPIPASPIVFNATFCPGGCGPSGVCGANGFCQCSGSAIGRRCEGTTSRVNDGLLAFYTTTEGGGRLVRDFSGRGTPLDLDITGSPGCFGGGVTFETTPRKVLRSRMDAYHWADDDQITLSAQVTQDLVVAPIIAAGAFTFEFWLEQAQTFTLAERRIFAITSGVSKGLDAFEVMQFEEHMVIALSTANCDPDDVCQYQINDVFELAAIHHYVITYNATVGDLVLYIDSVEEWRQSINQPLYTAEWTVPTRQVSLFNEIGGNYPWDGDLHVMAFYDRALTAMEVFTNYAAGNLDVVVIPGCTTCAEPGWRNKYFDCNNGFAQIDWTSSYLYADGWPAEAINAPFIRPAYTSIYYFVQLLNWDGSMHWQDPYSGFQKADVTVATAVSTQTERGLAYDDGRLRARYLTTTVGPTTISSITLGPNQMVGNPARYGRHSRPTTIPNWADFQVQPGSLHYAQMTSVPDYTAPIPNTVGAVIVTVATTDYFNNVRPPNSEPLQARIFWAAFGDEVIPVDTMMQFSFAPREVGLTHLSIELVSNGADYLQTQFEVYSATDAAHAATSSASVAPSTVNLAGTFGLAATVVLRDALNMSRPTGRRLTIPIESSNDDFMEDTCGEFAGMISCGTSTLWIGLGGYCRHLALRFQLPIPAGAQISHAHTEFQAESGYPERGTTSAYTAVAADDAESCRNVDGEITSSPKTSARVLHTPIPDYDQYAEGVPQWSPDLWTMVQEVVGRPGWENDNHVVIVVSPTNDGQRREIYAYEGTGSPARLVVDYGALGVSSSFDRLRGTATKVDDASVSFPVDYIARAGGSGAYQGLANITTAGTYAVTAELETDPGVWTPLAFTTPTLVEVVAEPIVDTGNMRPAPPFQVIGRLNSTVCALAADRFGNPLVNPAVTAAVNASLVGFRFSPLNGRPSVVVAAGAATETSPGVYCAAFNLTELVIHNVTVSYSGAVSPLVAYVSVVSSDLDVANTVVFGERATFGYAEKDGNTFYVQARDTYGNNRTAPNNATVWFTGGGGPGKRRLLSGLNATATYAGAGIYDVVYNTSSIGDYEISIELDGLAIPQNPIGVTVYPGRTSPRTSFAIGPGVEGGQLSNVVQEFVIVSVDDYGNTRTVGGSVFDVEVRKTPEGIIFSASVVDNGDGTYNGTYLVETGGTYTVTIAVLVDGSYRDFDTPYTFDILAYCVPGSFAVQPRGPCSFCEPGTFSTAVSVAACDECPEATTSRSNASAVTDCFCREGFFARMTGVECESCPPGGVCDGGESLPYAQPGFFPSENSDAEFVTCPVEEACLGGNPFECDPKYRDRLCASCADLHYKKNGVCIPCGSTTGVLVVAIIALWLACGALVLFNVFSNSAAQFATIAIAFNSLQVSAMFGQFGLAWPPFVEKVFNVMSIINWNIELTAPECVVQGANGYLLKWATVMSAPLIIMLMFLSWLAVFVYPQRWFAKACGPRFEGRYPKFFSGLDGIAYVDPEEVFAFDDEVKESYKPGEMTNKTRCRLQCASCLARPTSPRAAWYAILRGWWQILSFAYLPLASMSVGYLACVPKDGAWELRTDASVVCYTGWYNPLLPIAALFALAYAIGIPVAIGAILRRSFKKNNLVEFSLKYGFLTGRYDPDRFYWEVTIMARKCGVMICMIFLSTAPLVQGGFATLVLMVAAQAQLKYRPFVYSVHNNLEFFSLWSSIAVIFIGTIFKTGENVLDSTFVDFLIVVALFSNVVALVISFVMDIKRIKREDAEINAQVEFVETQGIDNTDVDDDESDAMWARAAEDQGILDFDTSGDGGGGLGVPLTMVRSNMPETPSSTAASTTFGSRAIDQMNPVFDSGVTFTTADPYEITSGSSNASPLVLSRMPSGPDLARPTDSMGVIPRDQLASQAVRPGGKAAKPKPKRKPKPRPRKLIPAPIAPMDSRGSGSSAPGASDTMLLSEIPPPPPPGNTDTMLLSEIPPPPPPAAGSDDGALDTMQTAGLDTFLDTMDAGSLR